MVAVLPFDNREDWLYFHIMKPEMIRKIDSVLDRVKDPESDLPVAQLGVIKRVRYNEELQTLYVFTDFYSHMPKCTTCAAIAKTLASAIVRDLTKEFQIEFPDLSIEFV
jgi:metal-sulfur cluster biosynthetic enzyme